MRGDLVPWRRGIDFLTVTVPTAVGDWLLDGTREFESGHPVTGFKRSERRLAEGGFVWRRWEPHQPSTRWGSEYESWQWPGAEAGFAVDAHLTKALQMANEGSEGVRCTHLDAAVDFLVDASVKADDLAAAIAPHLEAAGIKPGIVGEDGVNTHYVGGRSSDRRVRIYRKDLQAGDSLIEVLPPLLRVELILKGDLADAMLRLRLDDEPAFWRAVSTHLHELTGLTVGDLGPLPPIDASRVDDAAQQLFQWVEQHGTMLSTFAAMGLPIVELAHERAMNASRTTQWRAAARGRLIAEAGVFEVVRAVRNRLRRSVQHAGRTLTRGPSPGLVAAKGA